MLTPNGRTAVITVIYTMHAEADVEWRTGETARFRLSVLRPTPGGI